jgi:DNA-binding MarR family transcriptional regulator
MNAEDKSNPFPVSGYHGTSLFCDRDAETKLLVSNALNGVNTTLLSERRMGKTGLIQHVFTSLKKKKAQGIYIDIYATQSLRDFINQLATAILKVYPEKHSLGKKFMLLLKSFRPTLSFDPLSGSPEVSFDFAQARQYEQSLGGLFSFLEKQGSPCVLAIDEFQQVTFYPEKNIEALLRSHIQQLKNVHFIFSGSSQHLLSDMFGNTKRPFFSSTRSLYLGPIPADKYSTFISLKFSERKRQISPEAIAFILEWTRRHTYYTQALCNKLFAAGHKKTNLSIAQNTALELLRENEPVFFQYRSLLTPNQWQLLRAIAGEDKVYKPSAMSFMQKYALGTPANVQRSLEALLNKEMVYKQKDEEGFYYRVYDCFLARWLEKK